MLDGLDNVRYGTVDYLPLAKVDKLTPADVDALPFYKRAGFTAENEFRMIAETAEPQGQVLRIDFPLALGIGASVRSYRALMHNSVVPPA